MGLNLEVSLEMAGLEFRSDTTAVTFDNTQTALNPSDYDGATYYFEIDAYNTDTSDCTVSLVNSGGTAQASIDVSSGGSAGDYKRYISSSWTPAAGENNYRLKINGTTSDGQTHVYARIKIVQVNATKTRLPFDLLASDSASYGGGATKSPTWYLLARNGAALSHPVTNDPRFAVFGYDTTLWGGTITYEFEALAYRVGSNNCYVRLYRNSNGNTVDNAELSVTASSYTIYRATIDGDSEWVNGNEYEADIHSTSALTTIRISWAKIFVKITSLSAARIFHSIGYGSNHGAGDGTGISEERHRYLYDEGNYTSPSTAWEVTGINSSGDLSMVPTLDHYGTNDGPGTTGDTEADDLTLSATKTRYVTDFSLTDTYRYGYGSKRPVGGSFFVFNVHLVINVSEIPDAAQTRTAADDLDNWADAIRHDFPDQGTVQGDSLNNWQDSVVHDFPEQERAYSADLNNWSDAVTVVIGFPIAKSDDLDNWLDNKNYDLAASGALTESKTDDLDNWSDSVLVHYGLILGDDLDNWDDAFTSDIPQKSYSFGDDLDNWLDNINAGIPNPGYALADDLNNWQDIVRHDFPYIYLQFGDTLNMLDGINKFGQPYPEDDLNYWQDNVSILMPSNLRYQVFVDWENDGAFGTELDNITSDVYEMTWSYGRDYPSQLTGNSTAGQATILLRNTTGKYNKFKTTSPLYGNILPGRKIKILMHTSDTSTQMWGGFLETIESFPSIHGAHTAQLTASGPIARLTEKTVNVSMRKNIYTGQAVAQVLDAVGWSGSDRNIERGYVVMSRWWTGGRIQALTAIRKLEDIETGFFRETKDGKLAYEDKFHRLKIDNFVSKAAFRDVPGVSVVYSAIHQEDPLKEIYNIAETRVRQFTLGEAQAVLWELQEEPTIDPLGTIEIWASCPSSGSSPGAIAADIWIPPVAVYDYTAGTAPGAQNATSYLQIEATYFDTGVKLLLTNPLSPQTMYISKFQMRGVALYESYSTNIREEDTESQALYGERTWPANDTYFSSRAEAEGYVQWVLGGYSIPRPIINLEFSTYRNSELTEVARTLDVSDMIDIEANATTKLGINYKFFIEKITHRVTDDGLEHRVLYECAAVVGAAFIERSVGDDMDNWDDHVNVQLEDVIYTANKTVVIHEMFGQGHSSRNSANGGAYQTNFATLTIDPSKFNGVVKCEWEIVGDNADSSSKDIDLYESGIYKATLSIGAGQFYYRTSTEIAWPSTTKYYVIEFPETTDFEDVVVYRSRLKIYQEDATATQIQIMFHGSSEYGWAFWGSPCSFQGSDYYPTTPWYIQSSSYVTDDAVTPLFEDNHCRWTYNASHWGTINAITLEAAMLVDPAAAETSTGYVRLYNEDTAQQVGTELTLANDGSPLCPSSDEKTTSIDPSSLIDGDTYVIQGKATASGSSPIVGSFRTCLYLELAEGLDAFETYYDMGREGTHVDWDAMTQYFDWDDFGHISYVFSWVEAAITTAGGDGKGIQLTDGGSNNYGFIGFPYTDTSYEIRQQEFNHRIMSAGNHYTQANASTVRLRGHRIVVYQNVNEAGLVDDLNNWADGISKDL